MAKITRISAKDPGESAKPPKIVEKPKKQPQKQPQKPQKRSAKATKKSRRLPKPLRIILKPFTALGGYFAASWREIRQVRWPNRKYTWKMTAAMLIYCALFIVFIVLLDLLFSLIFNNLLG